MKKLGLVLVLLLSGCSRIVPPARTNYNYEKIEKMELLDDFTNIDIDSGFSDVILKSGKTFEIHTEFYGAKWKPEFSVKEDTLHVSVIDTMPNTVNWNANKSNKIEITYPADSQFKELMIFTEFGDLEASDLNGDKIQLNLSYADFKLKDCAWQDYKLNYSFSDGTMRNITLGSGSFDFDYTTLDIEGLMADKMASNSSFTTLTAENIQLKDFIFNGEYSEVDLRKAVGESFDYTNQFGSLDYRGEILKTGSLYSSYGDIDLKLNQDVQDFRFDFNPDMADIYLNKDHFEKASSVNSGSVSMTVGIEFGTANIDTD